MSFGQNLQCLRKLRNKMTQEQLAQNLSVSRQTVSKWELDIVYPEMDKVIELCDLFSCTMDELIREDLNMINDAYSNIRIEKVNAFDYIKYAVISQNPETDALNHVKKWAAELKMTDPEIIGWDFPFLSQEQVNVLHMHGYEAALIVNNKILNLKESPEVIHQKDQSYIVITVRLSSAEPFRLIPNAYKVLMTHMKINGMKHKQSKEIIPCFEKEYVKADIAYMDIHIALE